MRPPSRAHGELPEEEHVHLRPGLEVLGPKDGLHRLADQHDLHGGVGQGGQRGGHCHPEQVLGAQVRREMTEVGVEEESGHRPGDHELPEIGQWLEPALLLEVERGEHRHAAHEGHAEHGIGARLDGEDHPGGHRHHHRRRLKEAVIDLDREELEEDEEGGEGEPDQPVGWAGEPVGHDRG